MEQPPVSPLPLPFPLDARETEAIALALAVQADILLMDEKRGREASRRNGLAVAGALGELLHTHQAGLFPDLRGEINRSRSEAGFFVDTEIERFILSQVSEQNPASPHGKCRDAGCSAACFGRATDWKPPIWHAERVRCGRGGRCGEGIPLAVCSSGACRFAER